jgi:hypothetical protein
MENTDNIYMDYIHNSILDRSEDSAWTELDKNNIEDSILSLTQSPILSPTHLPNVHIQNNSTENRDDSIKIDSTFLGLFLGFPIGIAAMTGFISGSATAKTSCCVVSIRSIIFLATTSFSPTNLVQVLQNPPVFDQNAADCMISTAPNVMRGIATLNTLGFSIGSLWYNPENQINLYQHVNVLIWIAVAAPTVFYLVEGFISGRENNLQNLEVEQRVIALPLNDLV